MRAAELYDRVVNWPGQLELTLMFAAALVLVTFAAMLLSLGRLRVLARAFGILGVLTIMVALFVIHEQTDQEKVGEYITVSHPRYSASTRFQIRVALLGLPAAAIMVMFSVLSSTRRRLRSTVPDHIKEGKKLLVQGEHDAALVEFNQALKISPYLAEAYFLRGSALEAKGDIDGAMTNFDQALGSDAQLALAYLHRGRLRTERGDLDGALADFDQVMIMRPNDPECFLHRGVCLAKKGILSDAIHDFQRVLKLTNHSDFADPARYYLEQLGGENPLTTALPSPNGAPRLPSSPEPDVPEHDYVL
jgi:tetratricopeptide (TPR) repeat protein